ncbi:MAG: DUF433 domain-containing protein [Caldilineaceae bacterium]
MEQSSGSHSSPIVYRQGVNGPKPVLRGTNLRVQTIVTSVQKWNMTPEEVAADYDLQAAQVLVALDYYTNHRTDIDAAIEDEAALEHAASVPLGGHDDDTP